MEFEDKCHILDRIVSGITIVDLNDKIYYIRDPNALERQLGQIHYNRAYARLVQDGIQTQAEATALLLERGIWSEENDARIAARRESIKDTKKELPSLEYKSVEKKKALLAIEYWESEIRSLTRDKNALLVRTAEYLANIERYKFLLFKLTSLVAGHRPWKSWGAFTNSSDKLLHKLMHGAFFEDTITEAVVRELARSEPWRGTWVVGCKVGNLLGNAIGEMTEYQRALLSWSVIYDGIYEHPEAPTQDVIDNDVLLDSWLEAQHEKRMGQRKPPALPEAIANSKEVGIIVDSPEDAQRVYNLNDSLKRSAIREREKVIKEKGTAQEYELPDVRMGLQQQMLKVVAAHHKGNQ